MKAKEADLLGAEVAACVEVGRPEDAYALLAPVLAERTPFRLLDRVGRVVGACPLPETMPFLDRIAGQRTEGGWVVIGSALGQQLNRDLAGTLARCRAFVVAGQVWYATDILGERVPGPALVADLEPTLELIAPWREDEDRWVRRSVAVAVHFWAKRSRGSPELSGQAGALLDFLEPMFEEWELDAAKAVGWGLKTLGRYYPDLVAGWLEEQVVERKRRHRAVVLRKATTYLSEEQRVQVTGG
jgi:hypothetical protein